MLMQQHENWTRPAPRHTALLMALPLEQPFSSLTGVLSTSNTVLMSMRMYGAEQKGKKTRPSFQD